MSSNYAIFALTASQDLGEKIAKELGTELGKCKVSHFADGEILVEVGESVRGKHVYIVQSTSGPVNDNLMELLILTDALKRASAREITAVIPYYGYARQDRKAKARQPITSKLVADMLTAAGVHRVVTIDLHAAQIQGFFNTPIDDMTALPILGSYFKSLNLEDVCVVSPDHGGAVRARKLANALHSEIAIIDKRRPRPNVAEVMGIIGDVEGKNCIIVDDMIDTGGTIVAGINVLKEKGAKKVATALKNNGWLLACHSYTHNDYFMDAKVTMEQLESDTERFNTRIAESVLEPNIYISPFGYFLGEGDKRLKYLKDI